jgi:hypothetical protein
VAGSQAVPAVSVPAQHGYHYRAANRRHRGDIDVTALHPTLRPILRFAAGLAFLAAGAGALAQDTAPLSTGQMLYLPIYSHLYHGDVHPRTGKPSETLVSTHISIRNTDPASTMRVTSARYFNTDGRLLREYLAAPQAIPPLGTHELYVSRSDSSGGSGANFLISWTAEKAINPPLVEALHADIREARTLLFVTTARPIQAR